MISGCCECVLNIVTAVMYRSGVFVLCVVNCYVFSQVLRYFCTVYFCIHYWHSFIVVCGVFLLCNYSADFM